MERKKYILRQPETLACENLADVYTHLDRFMQKETQIVIGDFHRAKKEAVTTSRRFVIANEQGDVRVRVNNDWYYDPRFGLNMHLYSTQSLLYDDRRITLDVPASVVYKSRPAPLPAPLVFTYATMTDDFTSDTKLPDELWDFATTPEDSDEQPSLVSFQFFPGENMRPSWHAVTNITSMSRQVSHFVGPEYQVVQRVDSQRYLTDKYIEWSKTYLPFLKKENGLLIYDNSFLLLDGPWQMNRSDPNNQVNESPATLQHTMKWTDLNSPFSPQ